MPDAAIQFVGVAKRLGTKDVLRGVDLSVPRGACLVVIGRSGTGKSVLLKHVIGLLIPDRGTVRVNGIDVASLNDAELLALREDMGMLFQAGALFDSMSVGENVGLALREHTPLGEQQVEMIVAEKLALVGLSGTEGLRPSSLSGGMKKRAALARALAMNPKIMLYDEPTTGLDPITATTITDLICKVRDLDGVSSILVTHQLRDAYNVARTFILKKDDEYVTSVVEDMSTLEGTEFMMLREGEVLFEGSPHELQSSSDPYIREFLA